MHSDCKVSIYNSRDLMALCKNNDIQIFSVSDWWLKWADEGKMWKLLLAQFLLCSSVRSLELKSRTSSKKTMYVSFIAKNPPVSHENLLVYLQRYMFNPTQWRFLAPWLLNGSHQKTTISSKKCFVKQAESLIVSSQVPACVEQRREQVQRAPRRGDAALLLQRQGVPEEDVRSR